MKLEQRLKALEAIPPKVDTESTRRLAATIEAMFASVSCENEWAPAKVAPFYWVEQPSDLDLLADRIDSNTMTEADRALLDSWPKCNDSPETLVTVTRDFRKTF